MGNRSIHNPDVEIIEHDLSGYTTTNLGTRCLITGFAQKGEDLNTIAITNRSAWLLNFGAPTNEAEEYFYNAGMEVLNQGGFLYAAKIPYSNDIAGIYAAAKYKISSNRSLYHLDEEVGLYYEDELDAQGDRVHRTDNDEKPGNPLGRFYKNYRSLKELGLNKLSLIAPAGQDFISRDLVEEYETGESTPASNVIYLVDKTRAIYSRATEIADKQDNRDARACIGIVPVITTLANTAWFQKSATGVEADVDELYQPIRSLQTITFPAGAASAAEYQPTKFVKSDLHTQLMKDGSSFNASLSERAATIAQSCLVNGNLVDGKFKPFICNDVCVVVFKAFVSTEDGKIDFDVAETWVGSLDPNGRDEKGFTTFIDTIINNNSEYIYCFSNLENPDTVLNPDHGFVAGSDVEYNTAKDEHQNDTEYMAATLFSAYAARMLGFGQDYETDNEDSTAGLAAPRDWTYELNEDEDGEISEIAKNTMGGLRQFYNQDAKQPVCTLDELIYGKKFTYSDATSLFPENAQNLNEMGNGYLNVSNKFITELPTFTYRVSRTVTITEVDGKRTLKYGADIQGAVEFTLDEIEKPSGNYKYDDYVETLKMGKTTDGDGKDDRSDMQLYNIENFGTEKLSELSILNSTDYLRAIYDFETLVDLEKAGVTAEEGTPEYEEQVAIKRQQYIQALIKDSIEKSSRYIAALRYCKKARINLDKLDAAYADYLNSSNDAAKAKVGEKYITDLYTAYNDSGLLSGMSWVKATEAATPSSKSVDALIEKNDALEAKLDEIINIDITKKEKMNPRKMTSRQEVEDFTKTLEFKFLKLKVYLNSQYYAKLAGMYKVVANIMEGCCYASQRYVESQRNIDDANIMLGFYPEMAEPIITYTTIAQSLNKIFEDMGNIDTSEIDVVCDAGISNIAQFVKQVYDPSADDGEDVGGLYQPVKAASYFKFNKNTDLAYWKTIVFKFDTFCKKRGDTMFCTEAPRHMVLIGNKQVVRKTKKDTNVDLNILPYISKITGFNTSYGGGYLNWYRTISDYTGDTLWVPPSIKAMGTYILTDKQYNWWDAPAGMRRGVINMVDTAFNPNKDQAGIIYDANWNYAINYVNDGIIQEGQKTFQTRQSALDRINVRRLICRIKRYVYFASKQFLYEPHTQAIREKYVKTITPFFEDLVNRGGLYDFKIICDSSNNTPEVIDRNELRVKIGIKPVKTIEFIIIDLCTLNTGADWKEMDSV